jgi:hypothetical protein
MGSAARIVLLVLAGALASCATKPVPQPLDARVLCQQLAQASASSQELISKDYFNSCVAAHSSGSENGPTKGP